MSELPGWDGDRSVFPRHCRRRYCCVTCGSVLGGLAPSRGAWSAWGIDLGAATLRAPGLGRHPRTPSLDGGCMLGGQFPREDKDEAHAPAWSAVVRGGRRLLIWDYSWAGPLTRGNGHGRIIVRARAGLESPPCFEAPHPTG